MTDNLISNPEPEFRTQTLSPVSPKPVYLPKPSNIPILQNQMDPSLNESSTYPSQGPADTGAQAATPPSHMAQDSNMEDAAGDYDESFTYSDQQEGNSNSSALAQAVNGETNLKQAEITYAEPSAALAATQDPTNQYHHHQEDQGLQAIQHDQLSTQSTNQAVPTNVPDLDIQALLDNIVGASAGAASTNSGPSVSSLQQAQISGLPAKPPIVTGSSNEANEHQPAQESSSATVGQSQNSTGINSGDSSTIPSAISSHTPAIHTNDPSHDLETYRERDEPVRHDEEIGREGEDRRWGTDVQKKYDAFLEDERAYVMKGEWDKFPLSSRLFIGNLSTEKVTKRDLFHVFHEYGSLAQISIKQAYGFVQFLTAEDCLKALEHEQGVAIRGKKIHLEISKPQARKGQGRDARRRSRSPDRRGDRYRMNDVRRRRSPSPRSRRRSPDRHGRRRSRSRSPYGRYRRSPSPRDTDDDCPLPRRAPHEVPDVQIIIKGEPDRAFIGYIERAFEARGIKANVLLLSPKLPEPSVMRRQIIEGVLAVMKIDRTNQLTQKFHISVFNRSANNVNFEGEYSTSADVTEYDNIDLNVCVELALRAKQNAKSQTFGNQFGGQYGLPIVPQAAQTQQPLPQSIPPPPQLFNRNQPPIPPPGQFPMDPNALQQLLSRAQQPTPQQLQPTQQSPFGIPNISQMPGPAQPSNELSRLLASAGGTPSQPNYGQPPPPTQQHQQQQTNPYANLVGLLGSAQGAQSYNQTPQPQQQHQSNPVDMKNIMAGLAKWKG